MEATCKFDMEKNAKPENRRFQEQKFSTNKLLNGRQETFHRFSRFTLSDLDQPVYKTFAKLRKKNQPGNLLQLPPTDPIAKNE